MIRHKVKDKSAFAAYLLPFIFCLVVATLLPLPTLALALFYALLVLLALIDPIFGLYWAILSVPVQELVHLPGGASYTQGAMLLALGAWALHILAHPEQPIFDDHFLATAKSAQDAKEPEHPNSSPYTARSGRSLRFWLWGAFLWALLLALAFSPYSRVEATKELLRWCEAFLIWLMVLALARRPWQIAGLVVPRFRVALRVFRVVVVELVWARTA